MPPFGAMWGGARSPPKPWLLNSRRRFVYFEGKTGAGAITQLGRNGGGRSGAKICPPPPPALAFEDHESSVVGDDARLLAGSVTDVWGVVVQGPGELGATATTPDALARTPANHRGPM